MELHTSTIQEMLGIENTDFDTRLGIANAIEAGLPVRAVEYVVSAVSPGSIQFRSQLVPKATLERRKNSKSKKLNVEESERLFRVAEVYNFAETVFGAGEQARAFMKRPHPMLDNRTPLDVALATGPGANAVINILGRAAYGGGA